MSNIPADLKYTKSHEWVRTLANGTVEIGITDHAQGALGDLVFVEVPEAGKTLKAGDAFAVVESVKAASDVYAPIAGSVVEGNPSLSGAPELRLTIQLACQFSISRATTPCELPKRSLLGPTGNAKVP